MIVRPIVSSSLRNVFLRRAALVIGLVLMALVVTESCEILEAVKYATVIAIFAMATDFWLSICLVLEEPNAFEIMLGREGPL